MQAFEEGTPERPVIITADGSPTVYNPVIGSHYHSVHGAIQESQHVFIKAGFHQVIKREISILEIGLGTGLNCFLTLMENLRTEKTIHYTAVEAFPLPASILNELNYPKLIQAEALQYSFEKIHNTPSENWHSLNDKFYLKKLENDFRKVDLNTKFDLVYFDAFGPGVQPEMWEEPNFQKIFDALNPNALLTTFCAKGEVKRTLKRVGFIVESLPGPPGKREMIRAFSPVVS